MVQQPSMRKLKVTRKQKRRWPKMSRRMPRNLPKCLWMTPSQNQPHLDQRTLLLPLLGHQPAILMILVHLRHPSPLQRHLAPVLYPLLTQQLLMTILLLTGFDTHPQPMERSPNSSQGALWTPNMSSMGISLRPSLRFQSKVLEGRAT